MAGSSSSGLRSLRLKRSASGMRIATSASAARKPRIVLRTGAGETGEPGGSAGSITCVVPCWEARRPLSCWSCALSSSRSVRSPAPAPPACWPSSVSIVLSISATALSVRVCVIASAKASAMSAASSGSSEVAVIVMNWEVVSVSSVLTEMSPSRELASERGSPRIRAASAATGVVCTSRPAADADPVATLRFWVNACELKFVLRTSSVVLASYLGVTSLEAA